MDALRFTGQTENYKSFDASSLSTGDLYRGYDFTDYKSGKKNIITFEPRMAPYYTILRMIKKRKYVTDYEFKFPVKRTKLHKRYVYITAHGKTSAVGTTDATVTAVDIALGMEYFLKVGCDYKSDGNVGNVYGQATNEVTVGDAGTRPLFLIPGQVLNVLMTSTGSHPEPADNILVAIKEITAVATTHSILKVEVVKALKTATNNELCSYENATTAMTETYSKRINTGADELEWARVYVTTNAQAPSSGIPSWTIDKPYSTEMGLTQIFKHAIGIGGSDESVEFNFEKDIMKSHFQDMITMHKLEQSGAMWFGRQGTDTEGRRYTQGTADFALNYGQVFSLTLASKTSDGFMEDLNNFFDIMYNRPNQCFFFAPKRTMLWLNQLGGLLKNDLNIDDTVYRANAKVNQMYKGVWGRTNLEYSIMSTPMGDITVFYEPSLDRSAIKLMGVNYVNTDYAPLNGNGNNRDTQIFLNVNAIDKDGVDRTVHLIQTEAGMLHGMAENYAAWV